MITPVLYNLYKTFVWHQGRPYLVFCGWYLLTSDLSRVKALTQKSFRDLVGLVFVLKVYDRCCTVNGFQHRIYVASPLAKQKLANCQPSICTAPLWDTSSSCFVANCGVTVSSKVCLAVYCSASNCYSWWEKKKPALAHKLVKTILFSCSVSGRVWTLCLLPALAACTVCSQQRCH